MKRVPWLVWAAIAVCVPFLGKPPAIDEESYLWIGAHLDVLRPYDWLRTWQGSTTYAYAHPPLWLWWNALWSGLDLPLIRLASIPWVALFAWSTARLSARLCHHPDLADLAWITSPIVVLGLHDTVQIDLPMAALLTTAVAAYREGFEDPRWFDLAGIALGLAIEVKYPAAAVVPVLVLHMARRGWRWRMLLFAALPIVVIEGALLAAYGSLHPLAVWAHRQEIAAGPVEGRVLGTLARAALLPASFVLLRSHPLVFAVGVSLALGSLAWARPPLLDSAGAGFLLACAALGAGLLLRGFVAAAAPRARRRKGDRDDGLLLGGWLVAVFAGVVFAHNYAAARYLLPAAAPAAILVARAAEEVEGGKLILRFTAGLAGALALFLALADYRYVRAGIEVAEAVTAGHPRGYFAGEWSFRHAMEQAGWDRYRPGEVLPAGTLVAVVGDAAPGPVDKGDWMAVQRFESEDRFPGRVVDVDHGVGLYAETLGPLPFGVAGGPQEVVTVYRVSGF